MGVNNDNPCPICDNVYSEYRGDSIFACRGCGNIFNNANKTWEMTKPVVIKIPSRPEIKAMELKRIQAFPEKMYFPPFEEDLDWLPINRLLNNLNADDVEYTRSDKYKDIIIKYKLLQVVAQKQHEQIKDMKCMVQDVKNMSQRDSESYCFIQMESIQRQMEKE